MRNLCDSEVQLAVQRKYARVDGFSGQGLVAACGIVIPAALERIIDVGQNLGT
jgi:hypothetical protein